MNKTYPEAGNETPHFVTVYGTRKSPDTTAACHRLDELGIPYRYVDIDTDPDSQQWVRKHQPGQELRPTLAIGTTVITSPTEPTLDRALRKFGFVI